MLVPSHIMTSGTQKVYESRSESDGPLEFEVLGDALIKSAINSCVHIEAESESDKEEEVGEKEGSGSSEQGAMPQTS